MPTSYTTLKQLRLEMLLKTQTDLNIMIIKSFESRKHIWNDHLKQADPIWNKRMTSTCKISVDAQSLGP